MMNKTLLVSTNAAKYLSFTLMPCLIYKKIIVSDALYAIVIHLCVFVSFYKNYKNAFLHLKFVTTKLAFMQHSLDNPAYHLTMNYMPISYP